MAGTAPARPLRGDTGPAPTLSRAGLEFGLARPADDAAIRALLRASPFPGRVQLTLEREPDAAIAGGIEGETHQVLIARDERSGAVAGIASRVTRQVWLNGRPARIGCLGMLRLASGRGRMRDVLRGGFELCRELHERDPVPLYMASIVSDNPVAPRLLDRIAGPAAPSFRPLGRIATLLLPVRPHAAGRQQRRRAASERVTLVSGSTVRLAAIVDCLRRHGVRHQLSPVWSEDDLRSARRSIDLAPGDFVVATIGSEVVGCAAVWDQRRFKQAVVRGYAPHLRRWRRCVNALAPVTGLPRLPPVGSAVNTVFLSHLAVDDDDAGVAVALVAEAMRRVPAGVDSVTLGLSPRSPLCDAVSRTWRHQRYDSTILLGFWPDQARDALAVDARPLSPEVAIL